MNLTLRLTSILFAAALTAGQGQADELPAGTYVTEGGWGTLSVGPAGAFQLQTVGANGHVCEVEGTIRGTQALTEEGCKIRFERSLDRVSVSPDPNTEASCRDYCGMRAGFNGDYFREVEECRAESIRRERTRFASLYGARRYGEAAVVLSALLNRCGRFLYWLPDEAQVRNDLAITYHHLGDDAACRGVLSAIQRLFVEDERKTGRAFAPIDEEEGRAMVRITRFNWKTCGGEIPEEADHE